jgi:hypothetical protein
MIDKTIIENTKEKSISAYLLGKGVIQDTKRSTPKNSFFHSPFTDDRSASLIVNEHKNTFFDYSAQMGGDVIKICMEMERLTFNQSVEKLSGLNLAPVKPKEETQNELIIDKVSELKNLHLEDYLHFERKINVSLCFKYLCEVHFHFTNNPKKKQYGIGIKNDKGGYDLRSKYSKIATNPKAITTINPGQKTVLVFEGFMDFLSAVTVFNKHPEHTIIILNGSAMICFVDFSRYDKIKFYGDNDRGGNTTLSKMPKTTVDCRFLFKAYNDFNEFLIKTSK